VRLTKSFVMGRRAVAVVVAIATSACIAAVGDGGQRVSADEPPVVATTSGMLVGVQDPSGTREWRGIPYAAPPVGSLRWRPPQPVAPWTGTRLATEFAQHCIQPRFGGGTVGSEDCLYLNVFAPPTGTGAGPLPVMVHLHPGGNGFGGAYEEASSLVERGVIVVSLNYRLGVFGFVGHPALSAEGSLPEQGLLDQIAALGWVHDNITNFGGDPGNITLFGMSAGSFDTAALVASPLTRGMIQRAAIETAAFWTVTGVGNSLADKERFGLQTTEQFGCNQSADITTCLRSIPASELVEAAGPIDTQPMVGGIVLPRPVLDVFQQQGASVPLLIGSNREEAVFFLWPLSDPMRRGEFTRLTTDLLGTTKTAPALHLYPVADYDSNAWAAVAMFTDAIYTCPTRRLALAAATRAPTYRYLYTHVMQNDPDQAAVRAAHSFEDPFLWHHFYPLESGDPYSPTLIEEQLSATMASYWTNFAKRGDPNGAGLPTWPQYDPTAERYLVLDDVVGDDAAYHVPQCALMDPVAALFPRCNSLCHYYETAQWWHKFRD